MKNRLILLLVAFVITAPSQAQQLNIQRNFKKNHPAPPKQEAAAEASVAFRRPAGRTEKCGFAKYMAKAKAAGYDEVLYESTLKRLIQRRLESGQTAFTGIVTIPVVFHSVYRNNQALGTTNPHLNNAMYQAQIAQMNADYANQSGSAYGVAADVRIRFCLALVDTAGRVMARPGVDEINGQARGWSNTNNMNEGALMDYFDNTIKPASIWDPNSYFNVWTAAMNTSGLLGYATFPSLSNLPGLDETETSATAGCVINWESIGSLTVPGQDPDYGNGRTLTHESGHFFGLRHIWGDDACGEDYCADTPPQDDATSGCPATGTLNNCTPSRPKMFENYMDYTDDACVNTFTANQALRCQTAMDNSPRRFQLMTSKACQARAGNTVVFSTATPLVVKETGNAGACPNTKTYSFNLYVSTMANGAATVTFNSTGSTATLGSDFTITPAAVSYTANDNGVKTVTITVIDDQVAESTETIQLGFTISGTGVVAGPDKQTITLYIEDDDASGLSISGAASSAVNLLNENFNASANIPANWTKITTGDGSSTPNQWVVSANGGTGTSGNAAHITSNVTSKPNQYNNANISDAYLITPLINAAGVADLTLSFKWRCLGEVGYDEGYIGYIPFGSPLTADNVIYFDNSFVNQGGSAQTASLTLPLSLSNTSFYIVFNWFNDDLDGSNPPFTIDDVVVSGRSYSVATAAGLDTAFSQAAGQTVNYYSVNSGGRKLIATVANPSQNLGCVTASVQSDGTGKILLNTTTGTYYRTSKVIRLAPATANTSATYQATLYFTQAELSPTWSASEISSFRILKVKEGADIFGTVNASDVEVITPTYGSGTGYYSYTGSFTGFSQFMLAIPNTTVPVGLLHFDAVAAQNSISLRWATSQEINNRAFVLERSDDGVNFQSIGTVAGKINSTVKNSYVFADNFVQPNVVYYYRLRQLDINGRETLSPVRQARISKDGITVTVSPVPARDVLNIFVKGSSQQASVNLVNAQGQVVKSWNKINAANGNYGLDISSLSSGVYVLNVVLNEEKIVRKVVIER